MTTNRPFRLAIVGGGASGYFASFRSAKYADEMGVHVKITIFETTNDVLRKVRISGGGRCNVTHGLFEVRPFCENYPRGQKELLSPFHQFQAKDTVQWFEKRGIELKVEKDGRMFPTTNSSETIIDCFKKEAKFWGIRLRKKTGVKSVEVTQNSVFKLGLVGGEEFFADRLLIATGSSPGGYKLVESLNHQITERAPSLFTFKIQNILLEGLSGTSFENASLKLSAGGKKFSQQGPLLITHWGLSGPALLKLSAWAAREMKRCNYQASIQVNWLGVESRDVLFELVNRLKSEAGKSYICNHWPQGLTKRFWQQLLSSQQISLNKPWNEVSKKDLQALVESLFCTHLEITGKSRFKEEFVECGGVNLKEIDLKKMESKLNPGLFFAGEVMDVDGITGGFNFQNAWTSAWLAGTHMISSCV